mgnify:CR=1 FL=1
MAEDSVASVILAVFIPLFFVLLFAFGPYLLSAVVGTFHQRGLQNRLDICKQVTLSILPIDPIHSLSRPANVNRPIQGSGLVMANLSISPSWWQMFVVSIHSLFGGNINTLDNVIRWGREEVIQRLREEAQKQGWDEVINVRLETAVIRKSSNASNRNDRGAAMEYLIYGTGVRLSPV